MPRPHADLITLAREIWKQEYGLDITREQAREIIDALVALAELAIACDLADAEPVDRSSTAASASPASRPSRPE